jgi:threonine synthase
MEIRACKNPKTMWRGIIEEYREFFPVSDKTPVTSLQEGNTPLIRAVNLKQRLATEPLKAHAHVSAVEKALEGIV